MAEASYSSLDERGIAELFQSPSGDVYKYMEKQARRIVFLARRKVGKRTRALELSIDYRIMRSGSGVYVDVSASNHIALLHHTGTRPHMILPQHGRVLRFKQGGKVVYARAVLHPGTRPNPYLVTALREVIQ